MNNVMQVPIADIILDPRLQMRETMDVAVIDDYAEHLFDLPPGKIVMGEGGIMWLTGGWHRYHANVKAKQTTMPCTVHEGTFQDALKEAAGENFGHGIRRTDADKKRAVKALLSEPLWADRSDRMIAEACHVSHPLVAKVRAEMAEANSQSQSDKEDNSSGNASNTQKDGSDREKAKTKREGKDGRKYTSTKPVVLCPVCQHRKEVGKPLIEKCEACAALRKPKEPKEEDDSPWVDEWGIPITKEAAKAFESQAKFDELLKLLRQAKSLYKALAEESGGAYLQQPFVSANTRTGFQHNGLETCIMNVADCKPKYTVCPYVYHKHEKHTKECTLCKGLGWLCAVSKTNGPPDSLIEAAKKAHGVS